MAYVLGRREKTAFFAAGKYIPGKLNLKTLALHDLGYRMITFDEVTKGSKTLVGVPLEEALPYAAADADMTLQLYNKYRKELDAIPSLARVYNMEHAFLPVIMHMEWEGIEIDRDALAEAHEAVVQEKLRVMIAMQTWLPCTFEDTQKFLNSPQKKSAFLFGDLGLPKTKKTKTGYSTGAEELERIAYAHPIIPLLLEYNSYSKLETSFTGKLPGMISDITGMLHCSFNSTGADTGRLSSSNPNGQNIPVRSELGRAIRKAFIAGDGKRMIGGDYEQIEIRILADMAEDPVFLDAFRAGEDVYSAVASNFYDRTITKEDEERQLIKAVVLGSNYGLQADTLARKRAMKLSDAQSFINKYFIKHAPIAVTQEKFKEFARRNGFIESQYGRRRATPNINSINISRRMSDERVAMNMPPQGTNADIIKMALTKLHVDSGFDTRLTVHDEVECIVEDTHAQEQADHMKEVMGSVHEFDSGIELAVEVKVGNNWAEVH